MSWSNDGPEWDALRKERERIARGARWFVLAFAVSVMLCVLTFYAL